VNQMNFGSCELSSLKVGLKQTEPFSTKNKLQTTLHKLASL